MSELDEQAVEAAAKALYTTWLDGPGAACMEPWSDDEDDETDWQSVARNDAITSITAYLAARPTPDAEAVEREEQAFRIELDRFALCAEKASIWYPTDEYHTKRTLERDDKRQELIEMFRKAAAR